MIIENLAGSDKEFIKSMIAQGYEFHKCIFFNLFYLVPKNNRSALRRDYFFRADNSKIVHANITGIIPPEIFNLKNLESLTLQHPTIENLMTPNFTYYIEHGLSDVTAQQIKEYYQYLDFLCYYSDNKVKRNDKENLIKIHEAVKHPEFYFPKATQYLCGKLNMDYGGEALSFRHNSSELYELSKRIKSEFLLDLLLIDSSRNLKLDERISGLSNLSELVIEKYERVAFPASISKLGKIKKLKIISNQMIGLKNLKINLDAQNKDVVLANFPSASAFDLSYDDKNNLYSLLIRGNDLKNYEADSRWRGFKNKFKNSIPFATNPLEEN